MIEELYKALENLCCDETTMTGCIALNAQMAAFQGHFPVQSILPGVVQLDLVRRMAEEKLKKRLKLIGVPQMKFTVPLRPEDVVRVTLTFAESAKGIGVSFSYDVDRCGELISASRGKVVFIPR